VNADRMPLGQETRFRFFKASEYRHLTDAYVLLKDKVLATQGWALFNFTAQDLFDRGALIGVTMQGKQLLSALHIILDGANTAHVQGVVTDPTARTRGLCALTLQQTLVRLHKEFGIATAELTVRILPGGQRNEAAYRTFSKVGFQPGAKLTVPFSGSFCDQHLAESCEGDESNRFFTSLQMHADLNALYSTEGV
jgi:hypothetical protein